MKHQLPVCRAKPCRSVSRARACWNTKLLLPDALHRPSNGSSDTRRWPSKAADPPELPGQLAHDGRRVAAAPKPGGDHACVATQPGVDRFGCVESKVHT